MHCKIKLTADTLYLTLVGQLCGIYNKCFRENWPYHNRTTWYLVHHLHVPTWSRVGVFLLSCLRWWLADGLFPGLALTQVETTGGRQVDAISAQLQSVMAANQKKTYISIFNSCLLIHGYHEMHISLFLGTLSSDSIMTGNPNLKENITTYGTWTFTNTITTAWHGNSFLIIGHS